MTGSQASITNLASSFVHWVCGTYGAEDAGTAAWILDADSTAVTLRDIYPDMPPPELVGPGGLDVGFDSVLRSASPLVVATLPMPAGKKGLIGGFQEIADWRLNLWVRCAVWKAAPATQLDRAQTSNQFAAVIEHIDRLLVWNQGTFGLREWTEDAYGAASIGTVLVNYDMPGPFPRDGEFRADWSLRLKLARQRN